MPKRNIVAIFNNFQESNANVLRNYPVYLSIIPKMHYSWNADFMATSRLYQSCERRIFSVLQTRMIFIYETARLFVHRIYCKKILRAKIPFCIGPSSLLADVFKLHFSSPFFPFSSFRIFAIFSRHFFLSWSFSVQKIVPVLKLFLPGQDNAENGQGEWKR